MRIRFPEHTRTAPHAKTDPHAALSLAIIPFVVVIFAYIGLETALSVFAIPYASDGLALDVIRGQTAISAMWFGLLAGRLGSLALRGNLDARVLIGAGILSCAMIWIGAATGTRQIEILYFCIGFSLGPVFPVAIALAGQRFPNSVGLVVGLSTGAGSTSGFIVPWLTGAIGDQAGVVIAIQWLAVWAVVVALGGAAIRRRRAHAPADRVS